jgi:hypothetical protein
MTKNKNSWIINVGVFIDEQRSKYIVTIDRNKFLISPLLNTNDLKTGDYVSFLGKAVDGNRFAKTLKRVKLTNHDPNYSVTKPQLVPGKYSPKIMAQSHIKLGQYIVRQGYTYLGNKWAYFFEGKKQVFDCNYTFFETHFSLVK